MRTQLLGRRGNLLCCYLVVSFVSAHVRWVYPPPRPAQDVKAFPCGLDAGWDEADITTLKVGVNQVVFDEFICHRGDMVRIALSMNRDDGCDEHVLLDRLPHNDLCNDSSSQQLMAVNISIPDVDCTGTNNESSGSRCSLQIIQVMASKFRGTSCPNPTGIPTYCGRRGWMYYSCARVAIHGRQAVSSSPTTFFDYYGAVTPADYEWPLVADWHRETTDEPWRLVEWNRTTPAVATEDENTAGKPVNDSTIHTIVPETNASSSLPTTQFPSPTPLVITPENDVAPPSLPSSAPGMDVPTPANSGTRPKVLRLVGVTALVCGWFWLSV